MLTGSTIGSEIERLATLRDRGVLTEDQFREQEARLLAFDRGTARPTDERRSVRIGLGVFAAAVIVLIVSGLISAGRAESQTGGRSRSPAGNETCYQRLLT